MGDRLRQLGGTGGRRPYARRPGSERRPPGGSARPGRAAAGRRRTPRCRRSPTLMQVVRDEMLPLDRNYFRGADAGGSLDRLDGNWRTLQRPCAFGQRRRRQGARSRGDDRDEPLGVSQRAGAGRKPRHAPPERPARQRPSFRLPVRGERARKRRCRASRDTLDHSVMIEIVSARRCIECDICVKVCPANVFDASPGSAAGDRSPKRLPNLLFMRNLLPDRRALCCARRRGADCDQ